MKFNFLLTTGAAQGGIFVDSPWKILTSPSERADTMGQGADGRHPAGLPE